MGLHHCLEKTVWSQESWQPQYCRVAVVTVLYIAHMLLHGAKPLTNAAAWHECLSKPGCWDSISTHRLQQGMKFGGKGNLPTNPAL